MKSMTELQDDVLAQCKTNGEWPIPFVHLTGVIEPARSKEHYNLLFKQEIIALIVGTIGAIALTGLVVWVAS